MPSRQIEYDEGLLSDNAKQNINQIKGRISNLQQKIRIHQ